MIEKIDRYYLEITSIDKLKDKQKPIDNLKIDLLKSENFELNKFLGEHPTQKLAVSSNMSPLMDRAIFEIFAHVRPCKINYNAEYIVYYDQTYRDQVYLDKCIKNLKSSKLWEKVNKYQSIGVYKVRS